MMKRILTLFALAPVLLGLMTVSSSAQTVSNYSVTLTFMHDQNTATTVTPWGAPYLSSATLVASSDPQSTWSNVLVTPPGDTGKTMTYNPSMVGYTWNLGIPTSSPATGNWGFQYDSGGTKSSTLSVTGSFLPAVPVSSNNGTFFTTGGPARWEFDPTQSMTLSWSQPSGYTSGDRVQLQITGPGAPGPWSDITGATSHLYDAGTFQAGQQYTASLIYQHALTPYVGGFGGTDQGTGVFQTQTTFTLQAIPEPSTYAALAGLGALGFAGWRRRRKA